MRLDKGILTGLGVTNARASRYLADLNDLLLKHDIKTPLRMAHFLAQVLHESGLMRITVENLSYSASRLREVFPNRFTEAEAQALAGRPEAIGNRIYANRLGNSDESSGDGFRYRGRGLIQLTGKANYRKFGNFVGEDVVAAPDRVAGEFAVHSAVFFWSHRSLNELADADDVRAVTKRVNGGLNGLSSRMRLLDKAKALLRHDGGAPAVLEGATHTVIATQLNLRNEPRVTTHTRIATLPQGTLVAKIANADRPGWVRVRVVLGGQFAEGFVSAAFLRSIRPSDVLPVQPETTAIPAVHLKAGRSDVTCRQDSGRAFPLGESGMPQRTATDPSARVLGRAGRESPKREAAQHAPTDTNGDRLPESRGGAARNRPTSRPAAFLRAAIRAMRGDHAPPERADPRAHAAPQRAPSDARDHAAARGVAARSIWSATQGCSSTAPLARPRHLRPRRPAPISRRTATPWCSPHPLTTPTRSIVSRERAWRPCAPHHRSA